MLSIDILGPILRTELAKRNCHPATISMDDDLASIGFDSSSVLRVISVLEDQFELDYSVMTNGIWKVSDIAKLVP